MKRTDYFQLFLDTGCEESKKKALDDLNKMETFLLSTNLNELSEDMLVRSLILYKYLLKKPKNRTIKHFERIKPFLKYKSPKIRQKTARLFQNADSRYEEELLNCLKKEDVYFVKEAIILSLGTLGGIKSLEYIKQIETDSKKVLIAKRKALSLLEVNKKLKFKFSAQGNFLKIKVQNVFKEAFLNELNKLNIVPVGEEYDGYFVKDNYFDEILNIRFGEKYIFYPTEKWCDKNEIIMIKQLEKTGFINHILKQFENINNSKLTFRIDITGNLFGNELKKYRENIILKLENQYSLLKNVPSDYQIQLHIDINNESARWGVSFPKLIKNNFNYRIKDVPASISPTVAAGIIALLKPFIKDSKSVLDPFMGSGTLLIERKLSNKKIELFGIDNNKKAIEAARVNFNKINFKAKLILGDSQKYNFNRTFDEIITNMPFGHRVGVHKGNERLYSLFFERINKWTHKGSVIALYTMEKKLVLKLLYQERHNFELVKQFKIDAGGLQPDLFIIIKK